MSRGSVGFNNTAGMAKLVQREGGLQLPVWRRHSAVCSARGLSQGQSSLAAPGGSALRSPGKSRTFGAFLFRFRNRMLFLLFFHNQLC